MPFESDEWPDEPDEPDPESRWGDPENDLVSVPTVETEDLDPGTEGAGIEVDGEVARRFWAAVVYANIALGGVSIGLLLVGFRGQVTVGGAAVAIGLFALYRTYDISRTHQEHVAEDEDDGSGSGEGDSGVEGGDDGSGSGEGDSGVEGGDDGSGSGEGDSGVEGGHETN